MASSDADESLSVSQNVLRSQGVETQSENAGSGGTKAGMKELKDNSDDAQKLKNEDKDNGSKVQVGAVVLWPPPRAWPWPSTA